MFTIPKRLIPIRTLSTFIAILLANTATLHADDPAAWIQKVVESYAKEHPEKPTPSEIESAFAPATQEDQRQAILERIFAHIAADDLPLSQLTKLLQDQQQKPELREAAAACLLKIVCGPDADRSAFAEGVLFDEFRNVKNDLEFRGSIMDKLAGVTRSPHLLLADLISLIQDPASTKEHFEIAHRGMTGLVSYRKVISREAAWVALRTAYRSTEPRSDARGYIVHKMFMTSHFPSQLPPPSRQLLSDAENFAAEVFCDTRNDDEVRESVAMEIGVYFRVSPGVLQCANDLLKSETTSEKLRAECKEIVARAGKSDLMRNFELRVYHALNKAVLESLLTPPPTQK